MYVDPSKISFIGKSSFIVDGIKLDYSEGFDQASLEEILLEWFDSLKKPPERHKPIHIDQD